MFIESLRPPWVFRIKDFLICYLDSVLKTLPSITDGYQKLNNYNKKPEDLHLFQNVLIYIRSVMQVSQQSASVNTITNDF